MKILKIMFHVKCAIKKFFLKLIYKKQIKFGKGTTWRKSFSLLIEHRATVKIGDYCFFNNFCSISSIENIKIGNNVIFGENVKIYDNNHVFNRECLIKKSGYKTGTIIIGDNCWIASNVLILNGARIGDNCVIAAGCIIDFEVKDNTIVKRDKNMRGYIIESIKRVG